MSRFLYWTILIGEQPTSFRAREAADLKPTLVQLQRTHADAVMKWFERGRLWASPEEALAARDAERRHARSRPATWRPGGRHEDPRQKYIDAKKAKWTRFKGRIRQRHDERLSRDRPGGPATPGKADADAPIKPRAPRTPDSRSPRPPAPPRPEAENLPPARPPARRTFRPPAAVKPEPPPSTRSRKDSRSPRKPKKG